MHVASALEQHGPGQLRVLRDGIEAWLKENEWASLGEMRGNMAFDRVPDPAAAKPQLPPSIADQVLLVRDLEAGLARARSTVPYQRGAISFLTPQPEAPEDAREFTRRVLRDWAYDDLVWPGSLVVSELVTYSILRAETVLDLTLSSVDHHLRLAVHDYGSNTLPVARVAEPTDPLEEDHADQRGLLVVGALTCCWGVFPSRGSGKTVWAMMQAQ